MFLFDWFWRILQYFGIIDKKVKLLITGLDNAGKSTLLFRLNNCQHVQHPQLKVGSEELSIGNVTFQVYDLGGHINAHRVWRDYFLSIDGIVFIVDASDISRLNEAKQEILAILTDDRVANVPVLILGNKIDKHGCYEKEQLIKELDIQMHLSDNVNTEYASTIRPCKLEMCSIVQQIGYVTGLKWIASQIE